MASKKESEAQIADRRARKALAQKVWRARKAGATEAGIRLLRGEALERRATPSEELVVLSRQRLAGLLPKSVETLSRLLDSEAESIRLQAAQLILDRVLGKPRQSADITVTESGSESLLRALLARDTTRPQVLTMPPVDSAE